MQRRYLRIPFSRVMRLSGLVLSVWFVACTGMAGERRAAVTKTAAAAEQPHVGPDDHGGIIVPTGQLIRPAGDTVAFAGRPVDIALSPDHRVVFVKNAERLVVLDAATWKVVQNLSYGDGESGSMHGLAVSSDSAAVYVTTSKKSLLEGGRADNGQWQWRRRIPLGTKTVDPCGVAVAADGHAAYVAISINNTLAVVDLAAGKVTAEIPTGVCPFGVVL